mgnify:CR=1 FL=1
MRFLTAIALTSLGMLILCSQESKASIGEVILHEGSGVIERKSNGEEVTSQIDEEVFSYDTIKTGKGKTAIEFIDTTRVDVTEHSKLIIDTRNAMHGIETSAYVVKA